MSKGNRVLLAGDLNAKHPEWDANCVFTNPSGLLLRDFAEDNGLLVHYTEEPTYFPDAANYTPSTLDIAVAKNIPDIRNMRTIPTPSSDHDPVYLEIWTTQKYKDNTGNTTTINLLTGHYTGRN